MREEVKSNAQNEADKWSVTQYFYDVMNQVIMTIQGENEPIEYEYDTAGRVVEMVQGDNTTSYIYDERGNLICETDPLNNTATFTYDILGRCTSGTDKNGITQTFTYDGLGRIKSMITSGQTVQYNYNWLGNITQMIDSEGITAYTYNARGELLTETRDGYTKTYTYDVAGNRMSFDVSGIPQLSATYTYSDANMLTKVISDGDTTNYQYNAVGDLRSETTYTNTLLQRSIGIQYNNNIRMPKTQTNKARTNTLETYTRTYTANGNVATDSNAGNAKTYTYDTTNRLAAENTSGFSYDYFSNRTLDNFNVYTYNESNQLLSSESRDNSGTIAATYDDNGNMLTYGDEIYIYNVLNRLESTGDAEYTYDGTGLMQTRTVDGVTTQFIWDGANIVAEITDNVVTTYSRGLRLISTKIGTTKYYYHHNPHGDVTKLTNASGAVVESYTYDAFGSVTTTNNLDNPFRYAGEYYDEEIGLIYLRMRWYDPSLGRFLTEDPIKDGFNWYVYCGNSPTNFIDPLGLFYVWIGDMAQAMGGGVWWDGNAGLAYIGMSEKSAGYNVNDGKNSLNQNDRVYVDVDRVLDEWGFSGSERNRVRAVAYALTYANGDVYKDGTTNGLTNPDYKAYPSNCTNYVSQALFAGNLPMDAVWWYDFSRPFRKNSEAWSQAPNLIKYLAAGLGVSYFPRGGDISTVIGVVRPGDVIGMALHETVNHAAIVTDVRDGMIYYSGNSNSRKNEPLSTILAQYDLYFVHIKY